jgi:Zn-dependent protease
MLFALAGPVTNLLIAYVVGKLFLLPFILVTLPPQVGTFLSIFASTSIALGVFNLLPIAPLDGEKILAGLLPEKTSLSYQLIMHRYGLYILIACILPIVGGRSIVSFVTSPLISYFIDILL